MKIKSIKTFCALAFFAIVSGVSAQSNSKPVKMGQALFESKCASCHGKDGTKGLFGAINLQQTRIGETEMFQTISKGRRIMPRWEKRLSEAQLKSLVDYVKTLRK